MMMYWLASGFGIFVHVAPSKCQVSPTPATAQTSLGPVPVRAYGPTAVDFVHVEPLKCQTPPPHAHTSFLLEPQRQPKSMFDGIATVLHALPFQCKNVPPLPATHT